MNRLKISAVFLFAMFHFLLISFFVLLFIHFFHLYTGEGVKLFPFCLSGLAGWQPLHVLIDLFVNGLLLHFIYMFTRKTSAQVKLSRHLMAQLKQIPEERLSLSRSVPYPVYKWNVSEAAAFTFGFWRPKIVVTQRLIEHLTEAELTAVLCHESVHCKHRDPLIYWWLACISESLKFFPVFDDLNRSYRIVRELMADREVITQLESTQNLSQALVKMIQQRTSNGAWSAGVKRFAADAAHFGKSAVNYRMLQLLDPQRPVPLPLVRMAPFVAAVAMVFFMILTNCIPLR